jgi:hypothetical protein
MTMDEFFHEHSQQVLFCKKTKQKKQDTRNLCYFIVNNLSHEMLKLYLN